MAIYNSTPYLEGSDNQVVPISKDTVLKGERVWESAYAEALAMDLVREQTSIPTHAKVDVRERRRSDSHGFSEKRGTARNRLAFTLFLEQVQDCIGDPALYSTTSSYRVRSLLQRTWTSGTSRMFMQRSLITP